MIAIARKNLLHDKAKFIVSVGGVALSTLLVLALLGLYFGIIQQSKDIPLTSGANYWVTERGLTNLFNSASFLPAGMTGRLATIPGVKDVAAVINRTTTVQINGRNATAAVVGYDTKTGIGKAGKPYKGATTVAWHEAIIDRAMAKKYGVDIGGSLAINGTSFKIVGLTTQTNALEFQYVFISYHDAAEALQQPAVNYYMVNLSVPASRVEPDIKRVLPTVELQTKENIAQGNANVVSDSFLPIISLMVFIGLAVGTTVIGLTIYTATAERAKEYGILKAVGVTDGKLFGIVQRQTLLASVLGFAVGVGLYALVQYATFYVVPTVGFSLPGQYFAVVFGLTLLTGILAALIPLRKLNRIDPAEAFTS
jgi:putative ABC transport system permease protein